MPKKKPSLYELGKVKGEIDYSNKQSVRDYRINRTWFWIWRFFALVFGSIGAIKLLLELLGD